jgi:peptidoglycan/LPS O-acetylase OafA/YrhL
LYIFVIALLFLIVAILSDWVLKDSIQKLIMGMINWMAFTIFDHPNLNGMVNTGLIVASVTWSLPFEWIFYFSLPLFALAIRASPPLGYFILSAFGIIFILLHPSFNYLTFFGGIIAAVLVRFQWICKIFVHRYSSLLALIFLFLTVFFFSTAYRAVPMIFLTGFFVIVASGNSLFGILNNTGSRTLGEFAYGIYLMHGIILFVTFNFVFGLQHIRLLSVLEYWSIVVGITPILIFICFLTYRFIEYPTMQKTTQLTTWVRSLFNVKPQLRT